MKPFLCKPFCVVMRVFNPRGDIVLYYVFVIYIDCFNIVFLSNNIEFGFLFYLSLRFWIIIYVLKCLNVCAFVCKLVMDWIYFILNF